MPRTLKILLTNQFAARAANSIELYQNATGPVREQMQASMEDWFKSDLKIIKFARVRKDIPDYCAELVERLKAQRWVSAQIQEMKSRHWDKFLIDLHTQDKALREEIIRHRNMQRKAGVEPRYY